MLERTEKQVSKETVRVFYRWINFIVLLVVQEVNTIHHWPIALNTSRPFLDFSRGHLRSTVGISCGRHLSIISY